MSKNKEALFDTFDEDDFFALGEEETTEEQTEQEDAAAEAEEAEEATAEEATEQEATEESEESTDGDELEGRLRNLEKAARELGVEDEEEAEEEEEADTDDGDEDSEEAEETATEETQEVETAANDYGAMEAADRAELNRLYPHLKLQSMRDLKQAARYGELRDKGLSAKEAFLATNADMLYAASAAAGAAKAASKAHLTGVAKKAGNKGESFMSNEERATMREYFGDDVSDSDMDALYKKIH